MNIFENKEQQEKFDGHVDTVAKASAQAVVDGLEIPSVEGLAKSEDLTALDGKVDKLNDGLEKISMDNKEKANTGKVETLKDFFSNQENKLKGSSNTEVAKFSIPADTINKATATFSSGFVTGETSTDFGGYFSTQESGNTQVSDIIPSISTSSQIFRFVRINFINGAAAVAGGAAPTTDTEPRFAEVKRTVQRLKAIMPVTREIYDDHAGFASLAAVEVPLLVRDLLQSQIMTGSGTGNNLNGLNTDGSTFGTPTGLADTVTDPTKYDAARASVVALRIRKYNPTHIIMNWGDIYDIESLKDSNGNYLDATFRDGALAAISGVTVVGSSDQTAGQFTTLDAARSARLVNNEGIEVLISTENDTNFEDDVYTMKVTGRWALAVTHPNGIINDTFAAVITYINKP